jgi:hypothetical protein
MSPEDEPAKINKQITKLMFLVHPDKNRDNLELATKAFEAVGTAKSMLADEDKMSFVMKVMMHLQHNTTPHEPQPNPNTPTNI